MDEYAPDLPLFVYSPAALQFLWQCQQAWSTGLFNNVACSWDYFMSNNLTVCTGGLTYPI